MTSKGTSSNNNGITLNDDNTSELSLERVVDFVTKSQTRRVIFSGVAGLICGKLTKTFGKMVLTVSGSGVVLIQIMQHMGYIEFNKDKIEKDLNTARDYATVGASKAAEYMQKNWDIFKQNLPSLITFCACTLLGIVAPI